jgi:glutamine synthetase type III
MRELYQTTVETEGKALLNLANKKIIPRAMKYLQVLECSLNSSKKFIKAYGEKFTETLDNSLEKLE